MNITFHYGNTESVSSITKCHQLLWPRHLERSELHNFDILPYTNQKYYWPDLEYGPYVAPNPYNDVTISNPYYGNFYIYINYYYFVFIF